MKGYYSELGYSQKERVIVVNKGLVYLSYLYNAEEAVISKVGDLCYSGFVPGT